MRKRSTLCKRSIRHKRNTKNKHRTRHIRGGNVDQETTKTLELVPIESDETAMIAGPGFSMNAEEYEAMMERLDRDGSDY
jgi:hypothetical protein